MGGRRSGKRPLKDSDDGESVDRSESEADASSSSEDRKEIARKRRAQARRDKKRRSPSDSESSQNSESDSDDSDKSDISDKSDQSSPERVKHKHKKHKHSAKYKKHPNKDQFESVPNKQIKSSKMKSFYMDKRSEVHTNREEIEDYHVASKKKESFRRVYIDRSDDKNGDRYFKQHNKEFLEDDNFGSQRERFAAKHHKYQSKEYDRDDKRNPRDYDKIERSFHNRRVDEREEQRGRHLDDKFYGDRRYDGFKNKNQDRFGDRQGYSRQNEDDYELPHRSRDDNYQRNNKGFQSRSNDFRGNQSREYNREREDDHQRMQQKRKYDDRYPEERDGPPRREAPQPNNSNRNVRIQRSPERERGPPRDKNAPPPFNSRRDSSPSNKRRRGSPRGSKWETEEKYDWGKKEQNNDKSGGADKGQKEKPNFGLSGKLTEDTNMVNGVVIKYSEPPEGRKPKRRWRFYPFKGDKPLPILYIHRQSYFLLGRDRQIADIPLDHPSISKQHAVLQYRLVPFTRDDGSTGKRVRPYLIDLGSANGTFVNNKQIDPSKYVELLERDVIKFGFSQREYVLLHENSKEDEMDDDVNVKMEEDDDVKRIKSEPEDA